MLYKEDWNETKKIFGEWWDGTLDRPLIQVTGRKSKSIPVVDSWAFLRYYPDVERAMDRLLHQFSNMIFEKEAYPNVKVHVALLNSTYCEEFSPQLHKLQFPIHNVYARYRALVSGIASANFGGQAIVIDNVPVQNETQSKQSGELKYRSNFDGLEIDINLKLEVSTKLRRVNPDGEGIDLRAFIIPEIRIQNMTLSGEELEITNTSSNMFLDNADISNTLTKSIKGLVDQVSK